MIREEDEEEHEAIIMVVVEGMEVCVGGDGAALGDELHRVFFWETGDT